MTNLKNPGDHTDYGSANRDSDEDYDYHSGSMSPRAKRWLISTATLVALFFLYVFCVLLPKLFIPESVELHGIAKVSSLDVTLVPVLSETVKQWRVGGIEEESWLEDEIDGDFSEEEENKTEMADLLAEIAASEANGKKKKERLILIGDIHGQYREFRKLLRKIKYRSDRDHLVVLGDFITKGPHSIKVLDFLIDNGVDCILGNHEYYVLQNYARFHRLPAPYFVDGVPSGFHTFGGFNDDPEFLLAKKLQPKHVQYINSCSVIKELGRVPLHSTRNNGKFGSTEGIAVHAGIQWDRLKDLNEQDPEVNLEMRALLPPFYNETTSDSYEDGAISWAKYWNNKQKLGELERSAVIYYGHDAGRGLKLRKFAKGLDSGCYKGDHLSALVMWQEKAKKDSEQVKFKEVVVQQKC